MILFSRARHKAEKERGNEVVNSTSMHINSFQKNLAL